MVSKATELLQEQRSGGSAQAGKNKGLTGPNIAAKKRALDQDRCRVSTCAKTCRSPGATLLPCTKGSQNAVYALPVAVPCSSCGLAWYKREHCQTKSSGQVGSCCCEGLKEPNHSSKASSPVWCTTSNPALMASRSR